MEEEADSLRLGLRVSQNCLHLLVQAPDDARHARLTFKDVQLDDDRWHTLVLAISGPHGGLTVDCGPPLEL